MIDIKPSSAEFIKDWLPGSGAEDYVVSANVTAVLPGAHRHHGAAGGGAAESMAHAGVEAAAKAAKRSAARAKWAAQVGLPPAESPPAPAPAPCCAAEVGALSAAEVGQAVAKVEASGKKC